MELRRRVATAVLLLPPAVALVLYAPSWALALVFAAILGVAALEWAPLAGCRPEWQSWAFAAVVLALTWAVWTLGGGQVAAGRTVLAAGLAWWTFALAWVVWRWRLPTALKLFGGCLTLVPAWFAVLALHQLPGGPVLVMLLLLMVWAADVGAYFVGHRFGRRKLAPEVSPGKTWEGALGGICFAGLVALVGAALAGYDLITFTLLALASIAVSIVGDLAESLLKRQAQVKDSGALLPGHGGVLDRLDSLFAAAPVFLVGFLTLGGLQ